MRFILFSLLTLLLLGYGLSQKQPVQVNPAADYEKAAALFRQARELGATKEYTEEKEAALYAGSLDLFRKLTTLCASQQEDSLLVLSHLYTGLSAHYFDSTRLAMYHYQSAIRLSGQIKNLPDSSLFRAWLFAGSIHYDKQAFDSAFFYYQQAEKICDRYTIALTDDQRLYNRLGVMQYETGNFRQAWNYFEKALSRLSARDPAYEDYRFNYLNNIGTALLKLEKYEEARAIFRQLLPAAGYRNEVMQNLGSMALNEQQPAEALRWFRQVDLTKANLLLLYAKTGKAFLELEQYDSAAFYLDSARLLFQNRQTFQRNIGYGLALDYSGQLALRLRQPEKAIRFYQQALYHFHNNFSDSTLGSNPENFSGSFSYIQLFQALSGKAESLAACYLLDQDRNWLLLALETYRSAFRLASYVERTYESDEARIFLGRIKHSAHSRPIDISLRLFELNGDIRYLEDAYFFDQLNKASILSLNIQENEWARKESVRTVLPEQEKQLRGSITRLTLATGREKDSSRLAEMYTEIREKEIALGRLQQEIAADPYWKIRESGSHIPTVSQLQKRLDNNSALLSFHLSEQELLILVITNRKFEYYRTETDRVFYERLRFFRESLRSVANEERYKGKQAATSLYQVLIGHISPALKQITRLVIIPDDELHGLPFEALQEPSGKFLVEQFSVQYQFSTAFFGDNPSSPTLATGLAFAPFASGQFSENESGAAWELLPASGAEVENMKGKILKDSAATRHNFFEQANQYPLLHLATHASVNNDTPSHSYIAFYPDNKEYRVYAGEIAEMRLDSVRLVILSACETGSGQLVKGEGLMSLTRAFAYAGCPDIITSLWMAEDQSTAFITGRLHYYLARQYSKDKALQLAKLDFLHNNETDPRFRSPGYWSHLVLIGNYEENRSSRNWWRIAILIIGGALLYLIAGRIRKTAVRKDLPDG